MIKNEKIIFFGFFPVKKGDILIRKGKIDKKWKQNNIFRFFSGKYGKMLKKVKNDEKGWYIDEKGQNW